jgi:hypothetical protein
MDRSGRRHGGYCQALQECANDVVRLAGGENHHALEFLKPLLHVFNLEVVVAVVSVIVANNGESLAVPCELLMLLGGCRCSERSRAISPPIHLRVTGALFFDGAHAIGSVGPAYAKPFTVWENHPVLTIECLGHVH